MAHLGVFIFACDAVGGGGNFQRKAFYPVSAAAMLSVVLGYGMGVSLFSRFFRLCTQRMVVCALFYGGGGYFLGMALAVLGCFSLFSAYGCAWGCIFGGLSGLKILLGIAVFLVQILLQIVAVSMLLLGGVRRVRRQIIERHIPKEQHGSCQRIHPASQKLRQIPGVLGRLRAR